MCTAKADQIINLQNKTTGVRHAYTQTILSTNSSEACASRDHFLFYLRTFMNCGAA